MRRLIIFLVILVGIEVVGDVSARAWAQSQITSRAKAELPRGVHVKSHIHAFPFLIPLFSSGRVTEVDGHFDNLDVGPFAVAALDIQLHGVRVNRDKLVRERKVWLEGIRDGTVSADITAEALSHALHVPVTVTTGQVKVTVGGVAVAANIRVQANTLEFGIPGVPAIKIPRTRLLPCAADVTTLADRVRVSCTIHNVPAGLLGAANTSINSS